MQNKGLDSARDVSDKCAALAADGITFVVRYYFHKSAFKDVLKMPEAKTISSHGMYVLSVWEQNPTSVAAFTTALGIYDCVGAIQDAEGAKQPLETPIYFAVDFDAQPQDFQAIKDYFLAIRTRMLNSRWPYHPRCYGPKAVIDMLVAAGLIDSGWEAQSTGWSGYETAGTDLAMIQSREVTLEGLDVDMDTSFGSAGGWKVI